MRDHHTNTEHQAGISARNDAWQQDDRDRDDGPGINAADHDCALSPHPETCWGCMAFVRANDREWQAHVDEQNRDWWAS